MVELGLILPLITCKKPRIRYTPIMVITSHRIFILLLLVRILIPTTWTFFCTWSLSLLGVRNLISLRGFDPTKHFVVPGCSFSFSYLYNFHNVAAMPSNNKSKWIASIQNWYLAIFKGELIFSYIPILIVFVDSFPTYPSGRVPLFQPMQCGFFTNFFHPRFGLLICILGAFANSSFSAVLRRDGLFCWDPGLGVAPHLDFHRHPNFLIIQAAVDKAASWRQFPPSQLVNKSHPLSCPL